MTHVMRAIRAITGMEIPDALAAVQNQCDKDELTQADAFLAELSDEQLGELCDELFGPDDGSGAEWPIQDVVDMTSTLIRQAQLT